MTRTKPKDAFGAYLCSPAEWHPAWRRVSYYARALAKDIISRAKDYSDLSMVTDGDWQTSVCQKLEIDGSERRNAKGALEKLVKARLLSVEEGRIRVHLVPSPAPSLSRPCPVLVPDSSEVVETTQITDGQSLNSGSVSERASAQARTHAHEASPWGSQQTVPMTLARKPVHEPDRDVKPIPRQPSEAADRLRVRQLLCQATNTIEVEWPATQEDWGSVAAAVRARSAGDDSRFDAMVSRVLASWQSDPRAIKHLVSNLVKHLGKYTRQLREEAPRERVPDTVVAPLTPLHERATPEDNLRMFKAWEALKAGDSGPLEALNG